MSAIDPQSSGSPSIGPTTETEGPSSVPLLSDEDVPQDSMSSFSTSSSPAVGSFLHILLEEPTILGFSKSVTTALAEAKHIAFQNEQQESLLYKDYRLNAILTFPQMIQSYAKMRAIPDNQRLLYQNENATLNNLNNAITTYNQQVASSESPTGRDASELQAMNTAIDAYNNGLIDNAQYNTAVTTYNTYMNTRNAQIASYQATLQAAYITYNSEMSSYAPQITALNQDLFAANQGITIPTPPTEVLSSTQFTIQPSAPQPLPVPVINNNSYEDSVTLTNPPVVSNRDIMAKGTTPLIQNFLASCVSLREKIDANIAHQEFIKFYINGKLPNLPNSYVSPLPEVYLNAQAGGVGAGSGSSLGSIVAGLSSVNLERTLSTGLFSAANQKYITDITLSPSDVTDQLQLLVLQQLVQGGLLSGKGALTTLADKFTSVGNNPATVSAALGLAFSDQIIKLIASGDLRPAIAAILKQGGFKADTTEFSQALDLYSSLVNLSLLKIGLSQLAQGLGQPELPAQILANLESPPLPPSPLPTLNDILLNPVSVAYLKNELTKQLVSNGELTTPVAQQTVSEAVNAALSSNNIQTDDQLRAAIAKALAQRGLSANNVSELTNLASDYLKAEVSSKYTLDTAIKQDSIDRESLISTIIRDSGIRADIVRQAVNQAVVAKDYLSQREFRDSIVNSLSRPFSEEDNVSVQNNVSVQGNVIVVEDEPLPEVDYAKEDNAKADLTKENIKQTNQTFNERPVTLDQRPATPEENRVDNSSKIASQGTSDRGKALIAATNAVTNQALAASGVVPEQPVEIPSLPVFKEQLLTEIVSKFSPSLGTPKAIEFANRIIQNLIGNEQSHIELRDPLSLVRQVQDQIETVKKFNSDTLDKALQENFVEFQKTNVDLYSFNLKLMDPANTLLYSMWTGIMYQGQGTMPTNFQHALQFNI